MEYKDVKDESTVMDFVPESEEDDNKEPTPQIPQKVSTPFNYLKLLKFFLLTLVLVSSAMIFVLDHTTTIPGPDCPLNYHRLYGKSCTIKTNQDLESADDLDPWCLSEFSNDSPDYLCEQELCFNKGTQKYLDPSGFCMTECPERTREEEFKYFLSYKKCVPNCKPGSAWNWYEEKCKNLKFSSVDRCGEVIGGKNIRI